MTAAAMPNAKTWAGKSVLAALAGASPPAKCPTCNGRTTDRFGFDCTTCFGTGEAENE